MDRLTSIIISLIFLTSFVGLQVHKHYSNGKLYSIAFFHQADSCCDDAGTCKIAHNSDDCSCEDDIEIYKISNNFISERIFKLHVVQKDFEKKYYLATANELNKCSFSLQNTRCYHTPLIFEPDAQSKFGVFLC